MFEVKLHFFLGVRECCEHVSERVEARPEQRQFVVESHNTVHRPLRAIAVITTAAAALSAVFGGRRRRGRGGSHIRGCSVGPGRLEEHTHVGRFGDADLVRLVAGAQHSFLVRTAAQRQLAVAPK